MTSRFRTFGVAASLFAVSAAALAAVADTYSFKHAPKEGDVVKYRLKADMEIAGTQASVSGLVQEKTLKVEADGTYTIESSQLEMKANFGGQEIDIPASGGTVTVYNGGGTVKEMRGENVEANAYRMANLNAFIAPESPKAVGESWTATLPADAKTGAVKATATYKVLGEEKVGDVETIKIHSLVKEEGGSDAASSDTTVWLRKDDFSLFKSEGKWTNAPFPGAPAPISATVSMTREN